MKTIFITGGTGYIGSRLIEALLQDRNYKIQALVRLGSENKLPPGCELITGNGLDATSYRDKIEKGSIFVHLIGVPHPSPSKSMQFKTIDGVSIQQAGKAAVYAQVSHFIYLSVAMYPTRIMKDFQEVRAEGEALLLQSGLKTSFVRPWYVLGPGHWWPLLLKPLYLIAKMIPPKREAARQLDTVTIKQMIATLVHAIKNPPEKIAIYNVPEIKKMFTF